MLQYLKSQNQLLVIKSDKNLGPALIEKDKYIHYAYHDHLSNKTVYRSMTKQDILNRMQAIHKLLQHFRTTYLCNKVDKNDRVFLDRHLQRYEAEWKKQGDPPLAQLYLLAKVHKTPLATRPIISVNGTILYGLGQWVDHKLQSLIKEFPERFPYYIKSSQHMVDRIQSLHLPDNCQFFSCDAVSMYTNINTAHTLHVLSNFFQSFPKNTIHPGLLVGIKLIMTHSIFQCGTSYWLQLSGTAMGTPPAPMYATLYFCIHEETTIPQFNNQILFYGQ